MAATITIVSGPNTKIFTITTENVVRIIESMDRDGMTRDPDETGDALDDWDFYLLHFWDDVRSRVERTENEARARVPEDVDLIT